MVRMLRTAVPTGAVFARSPSFIIKEDGTVVETVDNPCVQAVVAGPCIAEFLASKGVARVIGKPGPVAERELKARGIEIVGPEDDDPEKPEFKGLESLLPAPPPYPPIPRLLLQGLMEGHSSPQFPEILRAPPEIEVIEDIIGSIFHISRGIFSLISLRRTLEKIFAGGRK